MATNVQKIAATLSQPSPEDIRTEIESEAEAPTPEKLLDAKDDVDPKSKREYTFPLHLENNQGTFSGSFTTKILTAGDKEMVGVMRTRLANGLAYDALDPYTQEINLIIAHLTFCLVKKPAWANDLQKIEDGRILQEIYQEVASHEATFHGPLKNLTRR